MTPHAIFADCAELAAEDRFLRAVADHQPFVRDGWRYATDGRMICRERATGEEDTPGDRFPNVSNEALPWEAVYRAVPFPELVPGANGEFRVDCEDCNGLGRHWCGCGHEHDCECCAGEGLVWPREPVLVADGRFLHIRYLELLRRHDAMLFIPVDGDDQTAPLAFRIGDIEGLVAVAVPVDDL